MTQSLDSQQDLLALSLGKLDSLEGQPVEAEAVEEAAMQFGITAEALVLTMVELAVTVAQGK
jgi:hypothetical protein